MKEKKAEQNQPAERRPLFSMATTPRDLIAGLVVFLVAVPLCLGIAVASNAPPIAGLIAGIMGGLIVGPLSGSHTSVSGPAAGLTAIVVAQIAALGGGMQGFEAFLVATIIAGGIQIVLGIVKAGSISAFFPSSVIKGLLAAIGVLLILKQIPHLLGHDKDPMGEASYNQPDKETTFTEIMKTFSEMGSIFTEEVHVGAIIIGLVSIAILVGWGKVKFLRESFVPGPLIVVVVGVGMHLMFEKLGGKVAIDPDQLVKIPIASSIGGFFEELPRPDFAALSNSQVYVAGVTIAIVASLESLLNLEAVDKIDKEKRNSPPSRELVAQGCGNVASGMLGGLPVTSVIVRGSVNVGQGVKTKLSAIFHGVLLVVAVAIIPKYMNMIPFACLAAILIVTGFKLASPPLFKQMWKEGRYQFVPFIITLVAIVFTDLLIGILIGLGVSLLFILNSNLRRPIKRIVESHLDGDIMHIHLANQVSFLNRAALDKVFNEAPRGSKLLIDASQSDYIDPDILSMIREFKDKVGPARGVSVNLRGFRSKYELQDEMQFADFTTRELQDKIMPDQVIRILEEGNKRFVSGNRLTRDFSRQIAATATGQTPLAAVLSCIDSRVPTELVFDLGIGDIFSVRVAGNVPGSHSMGSLEYSVAIAGVKLVVVLGHTRCGAVTSSVELRQLGKTPNEVTGCQHLDSIVEEIQASLDDSSSTFQSKSAQEDEQPDPDFVDEIARRNVLRSVRAITEQSRTIREAVESERAIVIGAMYDVATGKIEFLTDD